MKKAAIAGMIAGMFLVSCTVAAMEMGGFDIQVAPGGSEGYPSGWWDAPQGDSWQGSDFQGGRGGNFQGNDFQGGDFQEGNFQGGGLQGNDWQRNSWNGEVSGGSIAYEDAGGGVSGGDFSGNDMGNGFMNEEMQGGQYQGEDFYGGDWYVPASAGSAALLSSPELTPMPTSTPIPTLTPTSTPIPTLTPTPTSTPIPTLMPTPTPTHVPMPTAALVPAIQFISPEPSGAIGNKRDKQEAVSLQVYHFTFEAEKGDPLAFRVKSDGPVHLLSVRLAGREAVWDWDGRDIILDKSAGMEGMVEILALYEEGEEPEFVNTEK